MFGFKGVERLTQSWQVVHVFDFAHVPGVRGEPIGDRFGKRKFRVPFDRDFVQVVNPAEIRQLKVSGEGRGFGRQAFHHASIAAKRVDVRVEEVVPRLVVPRREPIVCHREPDARRDSSGKQPVVISTPATCPYSGCPAHREPS